MLAGAVLAGAGSGASCSLASRGAPVSTATGTAPSLLFLTWCEVVLFNVLLLLLLVAAAAAALLPTLGLLHVVCPAGTSLLSRRLCNSSRCGLLRIMSSRRPLRKGTVCCRKRSALTCMVGWMASRTGTVRQRPSSLLSALPLPLPLLPSVQRVLVAVPW